MSFDKEYKKLNSEQRQAVDTTNGPVLVIAGAGTGKTNVVVLRICRLKSEGISAKRLLALTFTEKAAAEMIDRVNTLTSTYELELPIMTFNAYGESILRRFASDIGLGRNFTVMGESAQIVFMRERIDAMELSYFAPLSQPDSLLKDIAAHFSLLKQSVITPEMYLRFVKKMPANDAAEKLNKEKFTELARAYGIYIALCRQTNVIDYDDQIYLLIELFRKRPNILKEVQASYDYVMVDEFQDTNTMQSVMVDMIAAPTGNLFVVGDDDQSIYGWRGATLANILDFKHRYPKAKEITLIHNYRSTKEILDSAYRLIQSNNPHRLEERLKINKRLVSDKAGSNPQVWQFPVLDQELSWIAEDIKERVEKGTSPGSIAVLARRNTTLQLLHSYLDYFEVNHVVAGQRYELYHDPAVRMLLEAIRAVVDPSDSIGLYHTLTGPLFSIPAAGLSNLSAKARKHHEPLLNIIDQSDLISAKKAIEQIEKWRESIASTTVGQLAYEILETSGYKDRLYQNAASDPFAAVAATRLSELFRTMKEFEQIALQPSAVQYVEALPALQAAGEGGEDSTLDLSGELVNILTIHKAKGLEWPIVYIADCSEGSFPLAESSRGIMPPDGLKEKLETEADAHLAEERRLMYVAMTRARDELVLTCSEKHSSSAVRKPSKFLIEAFGESAFTKPLADRLQTGITIAYGSPEKHDVSIPSSILKNDHVYLTVSQIQKYLDCPLDFYYCYVLNVPREPSPALQYGSIMHSLIEDINRGLIAGQPVSILELESRLKAQWPRVGYLSARHRDRAYEQAKKTLRQVHELVTQAGRVPIAVEQPFAFEVPEANLSVRGRFDAVFQNENGIEIVDYKTSESVDSAEKAKQRATSSQQLTLYALAWQKAHDELPALVTLNFIDTNQLGSVKKTQRGIDSAYQRLQAVADGIRNQAFGPGRDHRFCQHPPV